MELLNYKHYNFFKTMEIIKRLYVHFILEKDLSNYDKKLKVKCKEAIKENCKKLTAKKIEKIVCNYFGKTSKEVHSKIRKREIIKCRQIIMYLFKENFKLSSREIGAYFNQDHATAYCAVKNVQNQMDVYPEFKNDIIKIRKKL